MTRRPTIRVGDSVLVLEADVVGRVLEVRPGRPRLYVVGSTTTYAPGQHVVPASRLELL